MRQIEIERESERERDRQSKRVSDEKVKERGD